jgi:4-amino-4-deoxy-L-arabinose transferase-like glycosyltransferase
MTESFYIVAIFASLLIAILLAESNQDEVSKNKTKYAILLGIALGTAALLRQLIILFIPFIFLWVWWNGRKAGSSLIPSLIITSFFVGLMILPFTVLNYFQFDRFVLLNTNAGYAFFWGNHPIYGTHFQPILSSQMGSYQELIPTELRSLDEAALDSALLSRGIQFIIDDIPRYILLSISRIPPYFMFWPSPDSSLISNISRVFSFGILWPFMLFGMVYAPFSKYLKQKLSLDAPVMLIYIFIFIYAMIHILTWTLIRYRLPIDAIAIIFAALAFVQFKDMLSKKRQPNGTAVNV